jgi:hypothetical protein
MHLDFVPAIAPLAHPAGDLLDLLGGLRDRRAGTAGVASSPRSPSPPSRSQLDAHRRSRRSFRRLGAPIGRVLPRWHLLQAPQLLPADLCRGFLGHLRLWPTPRVPLANDISLMLSVRDSWCTFMVLLILVSHSNCSTKCEANVSVRELGISDRLETTKV